MPWKESSAMDERLRFVQDVYRGVDSFTELCARYGISRTAGYATLAKYADGGPARPCRPAA
jgi:transposase-like protein